MSPIHFIISPLFITPCMNIAGGLWIFVERGFSSMDPNMFHLLTSHIAYLLLFLFRRCCIVLCSVYFLPFSASYHLPFIFAGIFFFFFLASRCYSLRFLTSVISTWIVMYWWYHVVLHWCNDIICRHLLL